MLLRRPNGFSPPLCQHPPSHLRPLNRKYPPKPVDRQDNSRMGCVSRLLFFPAAYNENLFSPATPICSISSTTKTISNFLGAPTGEAFLTQPPFECDTCQHFRRRFPRPDGFGDCLMKSHCAAPAGRHPSAESAHWVCFGAERDFPPPRFWVAWFAGAIGFAFEPPVCDQIWAH